MGKQIEHTGIVTDIHGNNAMIQINEVSACAACHVKAACMAGEEQVKIIEAPATDLQKGERVNVFFEYNQGVKALMLGYMVPFLVLITLLITLSTLGMNEMVIGGVSIAGLAPYYLVLWLNKNKLKQAFKFEIRKL